MKLPAVIEYLSGKTWNKAIVIVLRVALGAVFIFSGFAKAVDPWGSYYKFTEYLMSMGMQQMVNYALFGAFAVAVVEFLLGISILFGVYRRGAPVLLLCMMVVMLPLTLYLAFTDLVPDCGCFGDALVISNWMTFWKNVVLTVALVYLLLFNTTVQSLYGPAVHWIVTIFSFVFVMAVAFTGYFTQPLVDFRPYKVGSELVPDTPDVNDDDYVFIYEKDGKQREFKIDSLPGDDWNYVDRRLNEKGKKSAERGNAVTVYDNGDDVTSEVISTDGSELIFLFPDISNVNISYTFLINELNDFAQTHGAEVFGLTSGNKTTINAWNDISMADYHVYTIDDSELKMIARGNPAVVYVKDGKIMWKRTLRSISPDKLRSPDLTLDNLSDDFNPSGTLSEYVWAYVIALLVLLALNRTYLIAKISIKSLMGNKNKE